MADVNVTINQNGPILIPGSATYLDADGNEQKTQGTMIALCRCGASKNKPFCDGAHKSAGFEGDKLEITLHVE